MIHNMGIWVVKTLKYFHFGSKYVSLSSSSAPCCHDCLDAPPPTKAPVLSTTAIVGLSSGTEFHADRKSKLLMPEPSVNCETVRSSLLLGWMIISLLG